MTSYLTGLGIPGIGSVPYGTHMCHFYSSRGNLLDALLPYFQAGLAAHERCLWIASSPLPAAEVRTEIAQYPAMQRAVASGQLKIMDALEWYGDPATLDPDAAIKRWFGEEQRAVADGYQGLRVTGNSSFFPSGGWERLMEYEKKLHQRLKDSRIVTCCSYDHAGCTPIDIMEVVHRHDGAFDRSDNRWEMFLTSELGAAASLAASVAGREVLARP